MDRALLRTFVAIAECGSFKGATLRMGRTQSALSMQIGRLEQELGQALFERGSRGVRLTEPGHRLLIQARRILRLMDETAASLSPTALKGVVRVGVSEEYGEPLLPQVLVSFASVHPHVDVSVFCDFSSRVDQAFEEGALDVAVTSCARKDAIGEILHHDQTVWATAWGHRIHEDDPLPLALFDRNCWWRESALDALESRDIRYRIAYSSSSTVGIQSAIAAGLAVGVISASMVPAGCRFLSSKEGFPQLPGSDIRLRVSSSAQGSAASSMAEAIRSAFHSAWPETVAAASAGSAPAPRRLSHSGRRFG